ncbi:MAG: ABC transporter ATP-binding protein [Paracoccaceae bacterium]
MSLPLLEISDLKVNYHSDDGLIEALRGVSLTVKAGEVVGIVGESGCGKSTLVSALNALLAPNAEIAGGTVALNGRDILRRSAAEQRALRGAEIAMVFQDSMTAFSPVLSIGAQLVDFQHNMPDANHREKLARAGEMLARVGIGDPAQCLRRYPHQLSGGMRQRAAMAAALLMSPQVLVADEPTTALDVTMEAQVLHLLRSLREEINGAILVVTHHLGVIGELCDRVYVMYAGQVVEDATVDALYHAPRHPYTRALINCDPAHLEHRSSNLPTIPGRPPSLVNPPKGCAFAPRCTLADANCHANPPPRVRISPTQTVLCHKVAI